MVKEQFNYNLAGEGISQVDGRGFVTSCGYDNRGWVATQTMPDADAGSA